MNKALDKYKNKLKLLSNKNEGITKEKKVIPDIAMAINPSYISAPEISDNKEMRIRIDGRAVLNDSNRIDLYFNYSAEAVEAVKTIDGRKYEPKTRHWSVPFSLININELIELGFTLDNNVKNLVRKEFMTTKKFDIKNIKVPEGLSLMSFQKDTIKFIEEHNGKAIVALDMGLGKTILIATYINNHPELNPVIVVVPSTLKYNWKNELEKWVSRKLEIAILEGRKSKKLDKNTNVIIINYDILSGWEKELEKLKPKLLVCDEAQYIKTRTSARSKAVVKLAKKINNVLPLSGTPATNRPAELYNCIHMVNPNLFSSFYQYANRYCDPVYNGFGWEFKGASNIDELHSVLSDFMIRYKKEDVLTELPEKTVSFVPMDLDNRNDYERARDNFIDWVKQNKGKYAANKARAAEKLVKMAELRHLAVRGSLSSAIQWIHDFFDSTDEKLVVFAIHKDIINTLNTEFNDICVKIDGDTKQGEVRQQIVDKFQNDKNTRLFIGNEKAAGVGITLTSASNMVFLELPWTPGEMSQCMDRIRRIGQKNVCNIYYLLPTNTIEFELAKLIDSKTKTLSKILDGVEVKDEDTLEELLSKYEVD